jgi:phosphoglucomutase/phosphomannomutase
MAEAKANSTQALQLLASAAAAGKITAAAATNIRAWLTEPRYAEYAPEVAQHIVAGKWQILDDVFWTVIPFGTGGRRGRMYPIGSNAINDRTIGESAQGLADYVKEALGRLGATGSASAGQNRSGTGKASGTPTLSCAIAYDTRHRSEHFAKLCAEVMTAAGFTAYFLQGYRSTPELSFAVRYKGCSCGIMVTASHNPPSDNAVKVYWSTGGQVLPPHDTGIIERVMNTQEIRRQDFDEGVAAGRIVLCQDEVDAKFVEAVLTQATPGPRDLQIIYSPLHGVGASAVIPVLKKNDFADVEVFAPHERPDGDFPNVPGHVSNPENPQVFDAIIARAKEVGADIVIATDPDCDRLGCAAPLTFNRSATSEWRTFTGNQIGALLADYVLETRSALGRLTPEHYLVETLVTSQSIRRIGDSYRVRTVGELHVGFKWIAGAIDEQGPEKFIFGAEESHGYLVGTYARDKDAAVAAMLLCELAAKLKKDGRTLHEKLDALFWQHGAHAEKTVSVEMPGSEGMQRMQEVMAAFRTAPPREIGGDKLARVRDYLQQTVTSFGPRVGQGVPDLRPLASPKGDLVILDLATDGNYVACRPSGTEPKIKFYMFTFMPPEQLSDLERAKTELADRLTRMEADLRKFAGV